MSIRAPLTLVHIVTVPQTLNFFIGQIGYMQEQGLTVEVIASPEEGLEEFGIQQQITVHAIEMPRRITLLKDLQSVWRLWLLLRNRQPAIVHAHTPKGGLLGMIAAWLASVPVRIYHVHGLALMTATGYRRLLLTLTERVSCHLAHQVLCVSNSIQSEVIEKGICPRSKIKVLHHGSINGIDTQNRFDPRDHIETRTKIRKQFGIPSNAPVIGFAGRLVRDKGLQELVRAWEELRDEYLNLHLLIVGRFEERDALPFEITRTLKQEQRIHLTDYIQVENIPGYISAMDLLVLPTYREGFPVTALESAAMAVPIVATRIPGCIDAVVDGVTGTLVPPRDANALAYAIRQYLNDSELRRQHGLAGRERVMRDFRPEDMWEAVYSEYKRLLVAKHII